MYVCIYMHVSMYVSEGLMYFNNHYFIFVIHFAKFDCVSERK